MHLFQSGQLYDWSRSTPVSFSIYGHQTQTLTVSTTSGHVRNASAGGGEGGAARNKQVKLVLLGDQGVGKSSLALRFVRGEFHEHHEATIGGDWSIFLINCQINSF